MNQLEVMKQQTTTITTTNNDQNNENGNGDIENDKKSPK